MRIITKAKLKDIKNRAWDEGYSRGAAATRRLNGSTNYPQGANLSTLMAYQKRGCPECRASVHATWWAKDSVGTVVFEYRCGTTASCNGSSPVITGRGLGCKERTASRAG